MTTKCAVGNGSYKDLNLIIAFAFNAKSFAIAILAFLFFIFFLLITFSGRTAKTFFSQRFIINYQESVRPRSDSLLGYTKRSFYQNCFLRCYSWGTHEQHDVTHGLCRVTSIHSIHVLRKQVSDWMGEYSRVKTEKNWVDK